MSSLRATTEPRAIAVAATLIVCAACALGIGSTAAAADDPSSEINPVLVWPPPGEPLPPEPTGNIDAEDGSDEWGAELSVAFPERAEFGASPRATVYYLWHLTDWIDLATNLEAGSESDADTTMSVARLSAGARGGILGGDGKAVRLRWSFAAAYEYVDYGGLDAALDRTALTAGLELAAGPAAGRWSFAVRYLAVYGSTEVTGEPSLRLSLRF